MRLEFKQNIKLIYKSYYINVQVLCLNIKWAFIESSFKLDFISMTKNCTPHVEDIDLFQVEPPGYLIDFTMTPEIFHFFALTSRKYNVFPSDFGIPPRISTYFTLPPVIFHCYPQEGGGLRNFSGKAQLSNLKPEMCNCYKSGSRHKDINASRV